MITALALLLSLIQVPLIATAAGDVVFYNYKTDLESHSDVKDAKYGCYTCCFAMILSTLGKANATPYDIWQLNGNTSYISSYSAIENAYNVSIISQDLKGNGTDKYNAIYRLCQANPQGVFVRGTTNTGLNHAVVAYIDSAGTLRVHNPGYVGWNGRIVGQTDKNFSSYEQFILCRVIQDNEVHSAPANFYNTVSSNVTDTTAYVRTDISSDPSRISRVGCRWGTTTALEQQEFSWPVGSVLTWCDLTFDGSEGPTLQPGTTYYYQFFVTSTTGEDYPSEMKSFTTTGGDKEPPVISNVQIIDASATGYTISCTVTDNKRVDRVQFPTWTSYNNQDDLLPDWNLDPKATGQRNGDVWTFQVDISDHNNERGAYNTHIYAWDESGNYSNYSPNYRIILPIMMYLDANGGSVLNDAVAMCPETDNNCNLSQNTVTREGYIFEGWYTEPSGGICVYDKNGNCTNDGYYFSDGQFSYPADGADITLYAHWQKEPNPVDPDPVDPNPVDPDPVDPDPVDPNPVDPAPVDPDPVDPNPVDPDPVDPAPAKPDPVVPGDSTSTSSGSSGGGDGGAALVLVGGAALVAGAAIVISLPVEITGHVILNDNQMALPHATVQLMRDNAIVMQTITDENGRFGLKAARGEYELVVLYTGADGQSKQTTTHITIKPLRPIREIVIGI